MLSEWSAALVFLALSGLIAFAMVVGGVILRAKSRQSEQLKLDTYECGEEPDGAAWVRFNPRYYIVALVFVLFDAEAAFLLPWSLNIRSLGTLALVEMFLFLAVLMLGWLYALRKGALKWQ